MYVTECMVRDVEKGGAGAAGGWMEGPGVQLEVVLVRRGEWMAAGGEGGAVTHCRRACVGAVEM